MPLVTPSGFQTPEPTTFIAVAEIGAGGAKAVDLAGGDDPAVLAGRFGEIEIIRVAFPSAQDGRGFSLARRLRDLGYRGRLRAQGHVISDQFPMALACGFDEVEISEELAERQPEQFWIGQGPAQSYREKLAGKGRAAVVKRSPAYKAQAGVQEARVTHVRHYTDRLFAFRIARPASFRFRSGEFVMIGLPNAERPVYRAYSIASPVWDDELEFFSIKVADGPLTQHLQHVEAGDTVLMRGKATGTLVLDALQPGRRLFLFSTGTGIAPFASIVRDPETYERYDQIVLTHTCRTVAELAYGHELVAQCRRDPIVGEFAGKERLVHVATTTRDAYRHRGRITTKLVDGSLFAEAGLAPLAPEQDRAMICGSIPMLEEMRGIAEHLGLEEGSNNRPGSYVFERAFVG